MYNAFVIQIKNKIMKQTDSMIYFKNQRSKQNKK